VNKKKKPCLNQGQCIILSNLTLQCVCQRDWTGERCEIPLSTCANQPCGPNAECRMLNAFDYPQDYVCVCNNQQSYGRNCQQTVPNPCLTNSQQFHPFAFSRRAFINCDDELIFFQSCNALLYWNQEGKRCERLLPDILRAPFLNIRIRNDQKNQIQSNIQWQNQQQWIPTSVSDLNIGQDMNIQQWSNQVPDVQTPITNTFMETTTTLPKIFHLKGFFGKNSKQQWQNNGNNQFQSSSDFNTQSQPQSWQDSQSISNQPWSQNQNQQILTTERTPQGQIPFQNQLIPPSLETTTVGNQGVIIRRLLGWQSNQQDSIPTFQTRL